MRPTPRQHAERIWRQVRESQTRTALAAGALVALLFALVALRTVSVHVADDQGALVGHCGIGYYVFGASNEAVESACRREFAAHALTFFFMVVVAGSLIAALVVDLRRAGAAPSVATPVPPTTGALEAMAAPSEPPTTEPPAVRPRPEVATASTATTRKTTAAAAKKKPAAAAKKKPATAAKKKPATAAKKTAKRA